MKKTARSYLIGLLIAVFFLTNASLVMCFAEGYTFAPTGSMGTARTAHTAMLLPNGKVLIAGGMDSSLNISFSSAELYDPVTGTFSPTGSMGTARVFHTATLLSSGKVLIAGGYDYSSDTRFSSAEVYDPVTGTFSPTGTMGMARYDHTATLLPSGKVLIAAGSPVSYETTNSAELYDPVTETFSLTGSLVTTRALHMATLLPSGKVLIVGGGNWIGERILTSAELYDPATETFTATGSMATERIYFTGTLLTSGKVLIVGGMNLGYQMLGSVELYDPAIGTFSPTGNLEIARESIAVTLLPSGKVLIAGGWNNGNLASAELYEPVAGAFTAAGSMGTARAGHSATLLATGKVLIAGGNTSLSPYPSLSSAELYGSVIDETPPNANAGFSQTVHAGDLVTLDGSGSSDPDGLLPLTYAWTFISMPAGSAATISDPMVVHPTFTADTPGEYVIQLIVSNSQGNQSTPATVIISTINSAPIADPGPDQAITQMGITVQLDGSQSYDMDDDTLTYAWTIISKPSYSNAMLSSTTSMKPTFVADIHGTYVIQLVVRDPWASSDPKTVTVSFSNIAPVANAVAPTLGVVGDSITLDGSSSTDANLDPLTYQWGLVCAPSGSQAVITNANSVQASIVPDRPGIYVVQLIVNDGFVNSIPDTAEIRVVSVCSDTLILLRDLADVIRAMDKKAFKHGHVKKALLQKLIAVIDLIEDGRFKQAQKRLEKILERINGCTLKGKPDKNDWIINCSSQRVVYEKLTEIINMIKELTKK
jgi:hypothetical protein